MCFATERLIESFGHSAITDRDVAKAILTLKNLEEIFLGYCSNINGTFLHECHESYYDKKLTIVYPGHLHVERADFPKFMLMNFRALEDSDDSYSTFEGDPDMDIDDRPLGDYDSAEEEEDDYDEDRNPFYNWNLIM